jgi:hypothetical protein
MDPSSIFRVDTPTASTVVRGARFSVGVESDGGTSIEVQQGSAEVRVGDETHSLGMGEQLVVGAGGEVERRRVFEPDPTLLRNRLQEAWDAPGATYQVEVPEEELNQFLAAATRSSGELVADTQLWLAGEKARLSTTLTEPVPVDLSADFGLQVVDGTIVPQVTLGAAGLPVPIPGPVMDLATQTVLQQFQEYLDQVHEYVSFSEVQVKEGRIVAVGDKLRP